MGERADRIEADIAPEFQPDLIANAIEHRRLHAGRAEQAGQRFDIGRDRSGGLAEREVIAVDVTDHARRLDLRRRVDDAADGALGSELVPLSAAGVDAFQPRAFIRAAVLVEIPIGDAVDGGNNARAWPEQRPHGVDDVGNGVGFQANDDKILRAEFGGIVGAAQTYHALFAVDEELEAVLAHRRKMRPTRDQADIRARTRQLHAEISANRAGAVDADLHRSFLWG